MSMNVQYALVMYPTKVWCRAEDSDMDTANYEDLDPYMLLMYYLYY